MIRDCSTKNTTEKNYPWIGILKSFGTIVLFTEPAIADPDESTSKAVGIVVKVIPVKAYGGGTALTSNGRKVGEVRDDWVVESFELYNGPVVISNS